MLHSSEWFWSNMAKPDRDCKTSKKAQKIDEKKWFKEDLAVNSLAVMGRAEPAGC